MKMNAKELEDNRIYLKKTKIQTKHKKLSRYNQSFDVSVKKWL